MIDPLSDILGVLRPRRAGSGAINFGGTWGVRFPTHHGIRCYAVGRGECWIAVDGCGTATHLIRDDCILLAGGRPFRIGSASTAEGTTAIDPALFATDTISTVNGGGACVLIGGHFLLDEAHEQLLSSALPPLVTVRDQRRRDTLGLALKGLWNELETPQPGGRLVIDHLNQMMLVFALRLYATSESSRPTGWLSALADPRIARVLAAIHAAPERRWTLHALATEAFMSRTVFAERFTALVGTTPMHYLTRWRMATAAHALRASDASVRQLAGTVGYTSGPAFSTAFRKTFGVSPSEYARLPVRPAATLDAPAAHGPAAAGSGPEGDEQP
ncbi:AraC family transcriptional regulator [Gemmatimonadetes bacterium T265]|nr:AraC family transcriptional regulator [Gemmatimonadetes bacterium T265]